MKERSVETNGVSEIQGELAVLLSSVLYVYVCVCVKGKRTSLCIQIEKKKLAFVSSREISHFSHFGLEKLEGV